MNFEEQNTSGKTLNNTLLSFYGVKFVVFLRFLCVAVLGGVYVQSAHSLESFSEDASSIAFESGVPVSITEYFEFDTGNYEATQSIPEIGLHYKIRALAQGLGAQELSSDDFIQSTFRYVQKNINTDWKFGLSKGALGAVLDQSGTPFDQAQLLVTLLAEGGVEANLHLGTISLDANQIGSITGVINSLNEEEQTFVVSAKAMCEFLTDGGIPFTINGQHKENCDFSGALSSVELLHVWVDVNGERLDPSLKTLRLYGTKDIVDVCSESCANDLQSTLFSNAEWSSVLGGTNNTVKGLDYDGLGEELNSLSQTMYTNLKASSYQNLDISHVIGGIEIDLTHSNDFSGVSYEFRRNLGDEVPDLLKVEATINFASISKSVFVDEIYGYILQIAPLNPVTPQVSSKSASYYNPQFELRLEGRVNEQEHSIITLGAHSGEPTNHSITIELNFPYASRATKSDGVGTYFDCNRVNNTYLDAWNSASTYWYFNTSIIISLGDTGPEMAKHFREIAEGIPVVHEEFYSGFINLRHYVPASEFIATANWMAQSTAVRNILEELTKLESRHHFSVGASINPEIQLVNYVDVSSGFSANSNEGELSSFIPFSKALSLLHSSLENAVYRQLSDDWVGGGLSSFYRFTNEFGGQFVDSSNMGINFFQVSDNYNEIEIEALRPYVEDTNIRSILPFNGDLPDISIGSTIRRTGHNGAFFSKNDSTERKAYYAPITTLGMKGAGAASLPNPEDLADASYNGDGFDLFAEDIVSLKNGNVSFSTKEELSTGTGSFPDRLSFKRTYNSEDHSFPSSTIISGSGDISISIGVNGSQKSLEYGWNHNFDMHANLTSDGLAGLGKLKVEQAVKSIVGIGSLYQVLSESGFEEDLTAIFLAEWITEQLEGNVLRVSTSGGTFSFYKNPLGSFIVSDNSNAKIETSGISRTRWLHGQSSGYAYEGNFMMKLPSGEGFEFRPSSFVQYQGNPGGNLGFQIQSTFKPVEWTFPDGNKINFRYKDVSFSAARDSFFNELPSNVIENGLHFSVLEEIENAVGNKINFGVFQGYGTVTRDADGAGVQFRTLSPEGEVAELAFGGVLVPDSTAVQFRDVSGNHWKYQYSSPLVHSANVSHTSFHGVPSILGQNGGRYSRITQLNAPEGVSGVPMRIGYDVAGRATTITDGADNSYKYLIGGLGHERETITRIIDPSGNVKTVQLDDLGGVTKSVDNRGNVTENSYDERNRLIETRSRAVDDDESEYRVRESYEYDDFSNVVSTTVYSRTDDEHGSFEAQEAAQHSYFENDQFPKLPTKIVDVRGNATLFSYNALGQLEETVGPFKDDTPYVSEDDPSCHDENVNCSQIIYKMVNSISRVDEVLEKTSTGGCRKVTTNYYGADKFYAPKETVFSGDCTFN